MGQRNPLVKVISILLAGVGVVLLALNLALDGTINLALPLLFLVLGVAFYFLVFALSPTWTWAGWLYIPGSILLVFGLIFLLNVITDDLNSWAYAWLLLVAGLGLGVLLASRRQSWSKQVTLIGVGLMASGVTFFALFGAIAGGLFIQVMAPILLLLGGLALYWLKPEAVLPEGFLQRSGQAGGENPEPRLAPDQSILVEPLSDRELEVLFLIDQGLSNPEIAERLTLATSTVKTHINNIYGKLNVQSRAQALKRARELKLLNS